MKINIAVIYYYLKQIIFLHRGRPLSNHSFTLSQINKYKNINNNNNIINDLTNVENLA